MKQINITAPTPESVPLADNLPESLSRRYFMLGLGAVALLPGCGSSSSGDGFVSRVTAPPDIGTLPSAPASASAQSNGTAAAAAAAQSFAHPGLLLTEPDFVRMHDKVQAGEQPWLGWWQTLCSSSAVDLNGKPNPQTGVYRTTNCHIMYWDIQRAYCAALRWKVSGDDRYADLSVATLDAWADTLKEVWTKPPGSTAHEDWSGYLLAGIQGHQWANVGEIMRTYSKWPPNRVAAFQKMLQDVFAKLTTSWLSNTIGWSNQGVYANWDLAALCGTLAIGVFCDMPDLYHQAINYYKANNLGETRAAFGNGASCHNVYFMHPGYLGQWQESGRDQGHATLGMSLGSVLCEMAWNQGEDLYGFANNRFLAGAEYVARSNLLDQNGQPYVLPFARQWSLEGVYYADNNQSYQNHRDCWELIYNHYVNRMGLDAPNVANIVPLTAPNYWSGNGDDMVFPTLTHRRDAYAGPFKAPSGLSAFYSSPQVILSWWGSAGAASYQVKRSDSINGPFTVLATLNAGDLLTFADTPGTGVWFYQVEAIGTGSLGSAASQPVRIAVPGEIRLAMALDDGSGGTASGWGFSDSGDRVRRDGTLTGGANWGAGRLSGKAIAFNGQGSSLLLPQGIIKDLGDFTVAMWVYANSLNWDSSLLYIGQDINAYMRIAPKAVNGNLTFGIAASTYKDEQAVTASSALPTGRWVHVAFTLQGTTGRLYMDGALAGSYDSVLLSPRQLGDQLCLLGHDTFRPAFNGRIQDFRLYSGALSDSDIAALAV